MTAINELSKIDNNYLNLVDSLVSTRVPIILSGTGASLVVANKVAHQLRSIGMPAVTLHPEDALHGDLGLVQKNGILILISKSGSIIQNEYLIDSARARSYKIFLISENSLHVENNLPSLKSNKIELIVLPITTESDIFQIIPSVSICQVLIFFDFVINRVIIESKISINDFHKNHPSGNLGRYLSESVEKFCNFSAPAISIASSSNMNLVLKSIEAGKRGVTAVVDSKNKVVGVISEGDLRRFSLTGNLNSRENFYKENPRIITRNKNVQFAWNLLNNEPRISCLIVVNDNMIYQGLLHARDLKP